MARHSEERLGVPMQASPQRFPQERSRLQHVLSLLEVAPLRQLPLQTTCPRGLPRASSPVLLLLLPLARGQLQQGPQEALL